jgi:cold shock CspA family protein
LDKTNLLPGQDWEKTIRAAIANSDYFLALLSSHSVSKRGFVQKELRRALEVAEEFPEDKIFVIPVRLDACEPSFAGIQKLHRTDLFPNYSLGLQELLRVLLYSPEQPQESGYVLARHVLGRLARLTDRGFGFITPMLWDKDLFFHARALLDDLQYDSLREGDWVRFDVDAGAKGLAATSVAVVDDVPITIFNNFR